MSVTLKLADEDAVQIGRILKAITVPLGKKGDGSPNYDGFFYAVHNSLMFPITHIQELSGAFTVAARANER